MTVKGALSGLTITLYFLFFTLFPLRAEETVTVGFLGDFSSVSKQYTVNMYMAAQLSVESINASGEFKGMSVKMIKRDGGNNPELHYRYVKEMVREDHIVAVFGGASSPAVEAASGACREERIPYLVSIGNSQSIVVERGHPYVFQFLPTSQMETRSFSIFTSLMPWKRYAWVGPDYSWGHDVLNGFRKQFREIGVRLTWTAEAWHPLGETDFRPIIQKVMKGNPEALVIASWGEDVRYFILQAKEAGLFRELAVFGFFTYDLTEEIGRIIPEGMWSLARGGPFNYLAGKYPETKKFVDTFHGRFGEYPNGYTICCFDSFAAWRQAVRKAGTTDPAAVAAALKGIHFTGLRGKNIIRAIDGQMDSPTYFGRLVYREEYPFAVWESVIEVPATSTWLSIKEITDLRKNK
ncbi:MAG: ABC transporter substrate-binding protein [Spirochaetales bacterium]|nr:ABC transporter substrate-binding protein [Spirochaetales bacterium]